MGKSTSIVLSDHFIRFIDRQLAKGTYGSASEVVRAGLRLLEEHAIEVEALQAALTEGEESDDVENFDIDTLVAKARREYELETKSRNAAE